MKEGAAVFVDAVVEKPRLWASLDEWFDRAICDGSASLGNYTAQGNVPETVPVCAEFRRLVSPEHHTRRLRINRNAY
jgi:hypothetical protein